MMVRRDDGDCATELPGSIPLYTRMGREIPNAQHPDSPPFHVERLRGIFRRRFPWALERRPPTGQYNCHGMTFANRRTGIYDPKDVLTILEDDGYRKIRLSEAEIGDVVVYLDGGEISHTGLVIEIGRGFPEGSSLRAAKVLSKWGQAGEYLHPSREGPYAKLTIEYRTDRP